MKEKQDDFYTKHTCDRCGEVLRIRTMSWFTTETICEKCWTLEREIKKTLRMNGVNPYDIEECGYIPGILALQETVKLP